MVDTKKSVAVMIDFGQNIDDSFGVLHALTPKSEFIYDLLAQGYSFELAPTINDGQLVSVSVLSVSAKKKGAEDDSRAK